MAGLLEKAGTLFYLVSPNASSFPHYHLVPNYIHEAVPIMSVCIVLDAALRWIVGRQVRVNEAISSIAIGILHEAAYMVTGWVTLAGYQWVYQYRLWDLPWDSLMTWVAAFILVDFLYYWIHRANHELNILWAVHQIHHSSEDYNLTVALRLSVLQRASHFGFYHPLALIGFPLPTVAVHSALNYLFQFWVHSEFVGSLGPVGWVFNTPSHHRVHHGANKWCLDKNYSSIFIIWDRIFGTYEEERKDSEIVYGLTDQPQTKNVLWHEIFYLEAVVAKARSMATWKDSLKAVFYGPGWTPGTPRLGDPNSFPDVKTPRAKHDPQLPMWQVAYILSHLALLILTQHMLMFQYQAASRLFVAGWLLFIFTSAGVLTSMYDGWRWAGHVEAARCMAYTAAAHTMTLTSLPALDAMVVLYFALSALVWATRGAEFRHTLTPLKIQ